MISSQFNQREFIATHEAGHAYFSWLYGQSLTLVSIRPQVHNGTQADGMCTTCFCDSGRSDSITYSMFSVPRVFEILAGRAATEFLFPEMPPGNSYRHDWQNLEKLQSLDRVALEMHHWKDEHPNASSEDFYQKFKIHLFRILKTRRARRAIFALAQRLQTTGIVSGREAASIFMAAHGKRQPKWALPLERHQGFVEDKGAVCFRDLMRKVTVYVNILRSEIMPNQDAEHNSAAENATVQRIADLLLLIKLLAMEDEPKTR